MSEERYAATMILSAVGDAIGYRNGIWEFERNPHQIWKEYKAFGELENIKVEFKNWRVSDDTIMHIATALALTKDPTIQVGDALFQELATEYIKCMDHMAGRAPGRQTIQSVTLMTPGFSKKLLKWNEIPYSNSGGGCGAAMRGMCIGLKYFSEASVNDLIATSIESGRITHNHPVGFLGAMVAALFTSYGVRGIPAKQWGTLLMDHALPLAREYLEKTKNDTNRSWASYEKGWNYFLNAWKSYLQLRQIPFNGQQNNNNSDYPVFPDNYDYVAKDKFYQSVSFDGWGGSSGHDSVIIAYDALLGAGSNWKLMIEYGALHGGDSDSTAAIGCAWWGSIYGFENVFDNNSKSVEFGRELYNYGKALFEQRK